MDEFHAKEYAVLGKGKLVASLLEQTVELAAAADFNEPKVDEIGKVLIVQVPIYERKRDNYVAFYKDNADTIWANATEVVPVVRTVFAFFLSGSSCFCF
jgi:hypothetical protein